MTVDTHEILAIQADGKIVIGGTTGSTTAALRYTAAGDLDNSFSGDGKVSVSLGTSTHGHSMALAADGKIVLGGSLGVDEDDYDFGLARLTSDGTLDATFSGDGKLTNSLAGVDDVMAIAIQGDGKIVAAGWVYYADEYVYDMGIARYQVEAGPEERVYVEQDANFNVTSLTDAFGGVVGRK